MSTRAALARPRERGARRCAGSGRRGVRRQRRRLRLSKDCRPDGHRRVDRARDHGRGVARRPRRQEEAPLQLLPGRGVRGAGQPAADERGKHHFRADAPNELWVTDVTEFRIPAESPTSPDNRLLRRHADKLGDLHVPERRDGELVASGRMLPAQGGRAPHGAQRPGLPLPLARVDRDMRRARHREVDVEEGLQPGQRARRGLLRKA